MISIIIPTLNEAALLPGTLAALAANTPGHEVIVVDGGSTDATLPLARAAGARVMVAGRARRAGQMNLGATAAAGEALLFLHADTRLAPGGLAALQTALTRPGVVGGAFARRFDSPSRLLEWTCRLSDLRGRGLGWFLGDQGVFVRRATFAALGGFREWDWFEDLDFARRLARAGRVRLIGPPVLSSARRFARRGPLRTTLADSWLTVRYLVRGRPPVRAASSLACPPAIG